MSCAIGVRKLQLACSLPCVCSSLWLDRDAHLGSAGVGERRRGQDRAVVAHLPVGERSPQPARRDRTVGFACRLATRRAPHGGSLVAQVALLAPDLVAASSPSEGSAASAGRIRSHPPPGWLGRSPVKCSSTKGKSSTPRSSRVGRVIPLPPAGPRGSPRRRQKSDGADGLSPWGVLALRPHLRRRREGDRHVDHLLAGHCRDH